MVVGGLQKFTLTDFPGRLAAIVFTRGCNFRCPYCHNPELVDPERYAGPVDDTELFSFLESRAAKLDGVVVTGGEPTIHRDLAVLLHRIKALGLAIKLDTNGSAPRVIGELVEEGLLDYIAMDIKSSPRCYPRATGVQADVLEVRKSVELIAASSIPHELRLTYLETLVPDEELAGVAELARGCRRFVVQPFQPSKALDPVLLREARPTVEKLERVRALLETMGLPAVLR